MKPVCTLLILFALSLFLKQAFLQSITYTVVAKACFATIKEVSIMKDFIKLGRYRFIVDGELTRNLQGVLSFDLSLKRKFGFVNIDVCSSAFLLKCSSRNMCADMSNPYVVHQYPKGAIEYFNDMGCPPRAGRVWLSNTFDLPAFNRLTQGVYNGDMKVYITYPGHSRGTLLVHLKIAYTHHRLIPQRRQ